MIREAGKIDLTTVFRTLLIILVIGAAQQKPWPGAPNLQAAVPFLAGGVLLFGFASRQLSIRRFRLPGALAWLLALGATSAALSPVPWIAIPAYAQALLWILGTVCLVSVFLGASTRIPIVPVLGGLALQQGVVAFWQAAVAKVEVTGTLGSPNALARFVILTWPLLAAAAAVEGRRRIRSALWALVPMLACLVVLSGSRLAMVAFVVQAGYLAGRHRPRRLAAGVVVLAIILLATVLWGDALRRDDLQRIEAWRLAADVAFRNPLLGTGPGTFALAYRMAPPPQAAQMLETPHNLWFRLACETGLPSILCVVWLTLVGWRQLGRLEADDAGPYHSFIPALRALILGMLTLALAEY